MAKSETTTDDQRAELEAFQPDVRCEVCGDTGTVPDEDGGEMPCPWCPAPSRRCAG